MSIFIPNAFIDQWEQEAKLAFQQEKSILRDTVRVVTGVTGRTHKFPLVGAGTATVNKARSADLDPMNLTTVEATATLTTYTAMELIDDFDMVRTNMDVRSAYTESVMGAISRSIDQNLITQLATTSNVVTLPTANELNLAGLTACNVALSLNFVPHDGNRFAIVSPGGTADILTDTQLTNALYVDKGALMQGYAKGVNGFAVIESVLLPGIAAQGSGTATNFFYHRRAVGLALAMDVELEIAWIPLKQSWAVIGKLVAGSVIIDPTGVFSAAVNN